MKLRIIKITLERFVQLLQGKTSNTNLPIFVSILDNTFKFLLNLKATCGNYETKNH